MWRRATRSRTSALRRKRLKGGDVKPEEFYGMVFQDSDVAKWLEAAAYSLGQCPNPALEREVDSVVELLAQVQQEDGYLNSYFTVKEPERKWTNLQEAHELYCAGHLMEAACAYYEATGKDRLLKIMEKNAGCIYRHFMEECPQGYSGPPGGGAGAAAAGYRAKRQRRSNEGAACRPFPERGRGATSPPNYFIERKGPAGLERVGPTGNDANDTDYTQSTLPVREQKDAVGHAVRAVYLYTAMADLAGETGDQGLAKACRALWESVTHRQMYVTGGIGSTVLGEAFTVDYDLPNATVYAETCASIGLIFFARQMLQLEAKGEYTDVMERALYNTVLGGMQLDGKRFFLCESLGSGAGDFWESRHPAPRPSPAAPVVRLRLLPAQRGKIAFLHWQLRLWGGGKHIVCPPVPGWEVESSLGYSLSCETEYPRFGKAKFTFHGEKKTTLAFHIPGMEPKDHPFCERGGMGLGRVRERRIRLCGPFFPRRGRGGAEL